MRQVTITLSDTLYDRVIRVAKKQGLWKMSDEMKVTSILLDGVLENERLLKMMEDEGGAKE